MSDGAQSQANQILRNKIFQDIPKVEPGQIWKRMLTNQVNTKQVNSHQNPQAILRAKTGAIPGK